MISTARALAAAPAAPSGALPGAVPGSPASAVEHAARALHAAPAAATTCTAGDGSACDLLRRAGLSDAWARTLSACGDTVLRILLVVVVGVVLRWLLRRAIAHLTERLAAGESPAGWSPWRRGTPPYPAGGTGTPPVGTAGWERRAQRARTLGSVLGSLTTGVVTATVALLVLGELGLDLAPLLTGAGVVGVAIAFGCQTLVKDFLSGVFLIAEDQYGVGDVVELGGTSGTVEAVGLRVTRLRSVDGTVWYVRNGDVLKVGNRSQGWARAVIDVDVPYGEDLARVQQVLGDEACELFAEPAWSDLALEPPEVWGVEAVTADTVVVRLVVKTVPLEQWRVARELRERIKTRFDREGLGPAAARTPEPPAPVPAPAPAPAPVPAPAPLPAPRAEADVRT